MHPLCTLLQYLTMLIHQYTFVRITPLFETVSNFKLIYIYDSISISLFVTIEIKEYTIDIKNVKGIIFCYSVLQRLHKLNVHELI